MRETVLQAADKMQTTCAEECQSKRKRTSEDEPLVEEKGVNVAQKEGMKSASRRRRKRNPVFKVGWRNVQSLNSTGALDLLLQDMHQHQLDVMGICEVRWLGTGSLSKVW